MLRQVLPIWMDSQLISETRVNGFMNKCQSTYAWYRQSTVVFNLDYAIDNGTGPEKERKMRLTIRINRHNFCPITIPFICQIDKYWQNLCTFSSGPCGYSNLVKQWQWTTFRFEFRNKKYFNKMHNLLRLHNAIGFGVTNSRDKNSRIIAIVTSHMCPSI